MAYFRTRGMLCGVVWRNNDDRSVTCYSFLGKKPKNCTKTRLWSGPVQMSVFLWGPRVRDGTKNDGQLTSRERAVLVELSLSCVGPQMLQQSVTHLQILGTRKVTRSQFHTEDPQLSSRSPGMTWRPGLVHPCCNDFYYLSCLPSM